MKLNPDCIRDVLIEIENATGIATIYRYEEDFPKYTKEEVRYHLRQCNLAGYLHEYMEFFGGAVEVMDLSPLGHSFLADIRSLSVWNKTKEVSKKIGISSIHVLKAISISVVTEIVKNAING